MIDPFCQAKGRKLVSRNSGEELGAVGHLALDARERRVAGVAVGHGRNARFVGWDQLSGFGPDAVVVSGDDDLRPPQDPWEQSVADGRLEPVGKRVLSADGNELGVVDDVSFDSSTGSVQTLVVGDREIPATALIASGPYAVVVEASQEMRF